MSRLHRLMLAQPVCVKSMKLLDIPELAALYVINFG